MAKGETKKPGINSLNQHHVIPIITSTQIHLYVLGIILFCCWKWQCRCITAITVQTGSLNGIDMAGEGMYTTSRIYNLFHPFMESIEFFLCLFYFTGIPTPLLKGGLSIQFLEF